MSLIDRMIEESKHTSIKPNRIPYTPNEQIPLSRPQSIFHNVMPAVVTPTIAIANMEQIRLMTPAQKKDIIMTSKNQREIPFIRK